MRVVIGPGEGIDITFEGTDGKITVAWKATVLEVTADMPDSSGREGVIYEEMLGTHIDDDILNEDE